MSTIVVDRTCLRTVQLAPGSLLAPWQRGHAVSQFALLRAGPGRQRKLASAKSSGVHGVHQGIRCSASPGGWLLPDLKLLSFTHVAESCFELAYVQISDRT